MAVYSNLLKEFSELTASEVIDILCDEFSLSRAWICFTTTGNRVELKTLQGATYLNGVLAIEVGPIEFVGGPPPTRGYCNGTLLTYLCDAILYHWIIFGYYEELVCGDINEGKLLTTF